MWCRHRKQQTCNFLLWWLGSVKALLLNPFIPRNVTTVLVTERFLFLHIFLSHIVSTFIKYIICIICFTCGGVVFNWFPLSVLVSPNIKNIVSSFCCQCALDQDIGLHLELVPRCCTVTGHCSNTGEVFNHDVLKLLFSLSSTFKTETIF